MTGELLVIAEAVVEGELYLVLPSRFELNEYELMKQIAHSLADHLVPGRLLDKLRGAGAFPRVKVCFLEKNLADAWYEFRRRAYEEIAIHWCEEHNIRYDSKR